MVLSRKKLLATSALIVGLGLTTACSGDDNPNPSNPSNPNAPRIISLSPNSPTASSAPQTLTVTGERFATGLTVLLDAPTGVWTTYSGSSINVQSSTQFTVTAMLNLVGTWDITLNNQSPDESNEVRFSVVP